MKDEATSVRVSVCGKDRIIHVSDLFGTPCWEAALYRFCVRLVNEERQSGVLEDVLERVPRAAVA